MKMDLKSAVVYETLNVLLVGNNPAEVETILNKLAKIRTIKIVSEIAFDGKTALERVNQFKPNHILIDDNIGKEELNQTISKLANLRRTKYIPITVIKNSNYSKSDTLLNVSDYLMKKDITGEAVICIVKNAMKVRRTQLLLSETYRKRRSVIA
jgi:DNA-binding NarL/FixJ family response regulator